MTEGLKKNIQNNISILPLPIEKVSEGRRGLKRQPVKIKRTENLVFIPCPHYLCKRENR